MPEGYLRHCRARLAPAETRTLTGAKLPGRTPASADTTETGRPAGAPYTKE